MTKNAPKQQNNTTKDIAIFGGTFDPIHNGHIRTAEHIAKWLNLKEIVLLPAHIPPHKNAPITSALQRVEMVKLAIKDKSIFNIDCRELKRDKPSYTVDTLKEYREEYPNHRLFFVIGMDSLLTFDKWYHWQKILQLCHLAVISRPGIEDKKFPPPIQHILDNHLMNISEINDKDSGGIFINREINVDVSSTEIRKQLQNGKRHINNSDNGTCSDSEIYLQKFVSSEVLKFINKNKLYL